jgi:hypothetical protein
MRAIFGDLATIVVVIHALWVLWVIAGAFLSLGRTLRRAHVISVVVTLGIYLSIIICPLTDLEIYLNQLAGKPGYSGGFLRHYAAALVYGDLIPVAPPQFFVGLLLFSALAIWRWNHEKITF